MAKEEIIVEAGVDPLGRFRHDTQRDLHHAMLGLPEAKTCFMKRVVSPPPTSRTPPAEFRTPDNPSIYYNFNSSMSPLSLGHTDTTPSSASKCLKDDPSSDTPKEDSDSTAEECATPTRGMATSAPPRKHNPSPTSTPCCIPMAPSTAQGLGTPPRFVLLTTAPQSPPISQAIKPRTSPPETPSPGHRQKSPMLQREDSSVLNGGVSAFTNRLFTSHGTKRLTACRPHQSSPTATSAMVSSPPQTAPRDLLSSNVQRFSPPPGSTSSSRNSPSPSSSPLQCGEDIDRKLSLITKEISQLQTVLAAVPMERAPVALLVAASLVSLQGRGGMPSLKVALSSLLIGLLTYLAPHCRQARVALVIGFTAAVWKPGK